MNLEPHEQAQVNELRDRFVHLYGQTDGTFAFPNSVEGDLLRLVTKLLKFESPKLFASVSILEWEHHPATALMAPGWSAKHYFISNRDNLFVTVEGHTLLGKFYSLYSAKNACEEDHKRGAIRLEQLATTLRKDEHIPENGTYPAECSWRRIMGGGESWVYLIRDGDPKVYGAKRIPELIPIL